MLLRVKRFGAVGATVFLAFSGLWLALARPAAQSQTPSPGEAKPMHHATGPFDVKGAPQKPDNPPAEAAALARMSLDKQYHGDLEATGQGEMLSILDKGIGSGGYVAMERVTGKLQGKSGSFVLQHNATMNRGVAQLNIIVVPDSGTGELTGISGEMKIRIEDGGKHFYDFDYTLPAH
jgi:hypothetical protein